MRIDARYSADNIPLLSLLGIIAALIAGCGGGGDGGSAPPPPQLLPPALRGQTYQAMSATYWVFSTASDYTALRDMNGSSTTITTSTRGDSMSAQVLETLDNGAPINANLALTLPSQGSTTSPNLVFPPANGSLSYMSFGEWLQTLSDGSVQGGFFAFGNATPASSIPASGIATYRGAFHAKAFEGVALGGLTKTFDGSIILTVDFGARTLSIATSTPADMNYDIAGTLSYASGTNAPTGRVDAVRANSGFGFYSGTTVATFSGPNAGEVNGTLRLTRPNPFCVFSCIAAQDAFVGSFGAER